MTSSKEGRYFTRSEPPSHEDFNVAIWLKPRNTFSKVLTNRSSNSFKLSDEIWECGVKHECVLWGEDYAIDCRLPPQTTLFLAYQLTAETKTNAWHVTSPDPDRNTIWLTTKPKKAHETRKVVLLLIVLPRAKNSQTEMSGVYSDKVTKHRWQPPRSVGTDWSTSTWSTQTKCYVMFWLTLIGQDEITMFWVVELKTWTCFFLSMRIWLECERLQGWRTTCDKTDRQLQWKGEVVRLNLPVNDISCLKNSGKQRFGFEWLDGTQ